MPEITCKNCGKVCASLKGWKMHMSAAHGGWDESDLRAVLGANASSECDVRQRMEAFAGVGLYISMPSMAYPFSSNASIFARLKLGTRRPKG